MSSSHGRPCRLPMYRARNRPSTRTGRPWFPTANRAVWHQPLSVIGSIGSQNPFAPAQPVGGRSSILPQTARCRGTHPKAVLAALPWVTVEGQDDLG
jgi:hypothetical protein